MQKTCFIPIRFNLSREYRLKAAGYQTNKNDDITGKIIKRTKRMVMSAGFEPAPFRTSEFKI